MKRLLAVKNNEMVVDAVLLVLRLVMGYAFVQHGWSKIQDPFHWMGSGSSVPGLFQALAALSEFGGGIALIAGLVVRLAALGIGTTMTVALLMHRFVWGDPFVNLTGGRSYELASAYLMLAVLLVLLGPGRYSMDRRIFGTENGGGGRRSP